MNSKLSLKEKWNKIFRELVLCIGISLVLQGSIYFFLDKIYLKYNDEVAVEKVDTAKDYKSLKKIINISNDVKSIESSYSGKYVSFIKNDSLYILNVVNGKEEQLELEDQFKILKLKWMDDRNRIFIIGKNRNSLYKMYSIDVENKNKKVLDLSRINTNYKIEDVLISSKTGVVYTEMSKADSLKFVYRITNNDDIEKISLKQTNVSNLLLLKREDRLAYRIANECKIKLTEPDESIDIDYYEPYTIINTDEDNNIYMGVLTNNKVNKIIFKNLFESNHNFKSIKLKENVEKSQVFIDNKNRIIINFDNLKEVKDITNNLTYTYKGEFKAFFQGGFFTISSKNELIKYNI